MAGGDGGKLTARVSQGDLCGVVAHFDVEKQRVVRIRVPQDLNFKGFTQIHEDLMTIFPSKAREGFFSNSILWWSSLWNVGAPSRFSVR